jgi:hypothetical protein
MEPILTVIMLAAGVTASILSVVPVIIALRRNHSRKSRRFALGTDSTPAVDGLSADAELNQIFNEIASKYVDSISDQMKRRSAEEGGVNASTVRVNTERLSHR